MYTRSRKMLGIRRRHGALGDTPPAAATAGASTPPSLSDLVNADNVKTAAGVAMLFHGYRRTGSVLWALFYGLAGKWEPAVTVPIAVAQGFGKRKACPW